jgi:hypothetical protein
MLRGLLIATIVAAFPLSAGAAAMSEDIPVPGGIDALAGAAGFRETPDRARFVAELTRLLFELPVRERVPPSPGARLSGHLYLSLIQSDAADEL